MVKITDKQYIADHYRALLGTPIHRALGNFRAGVEGVPSVLRRVYGVDKVPVRGLIRSRVWDHGNIMAFNFRSFFEYCRKNGVSALPSSLVFNLFKLFYRCFRLNSVTNFSYA